jgi:DNA topoisomerase IA
VISSWGEEGRVVQVRVNLAAAEVVLQVSARKQVTAGYLAVWNPQEIRAKYAHLSRLGGEGEEPNEEGIEDAAGEDGDGEDAAAGDAVAVACSGPAEQVPAEALYDVLKGWTKGSDVKIEDVMSQERHTEPPRRFSEALLVKELESLGIGRPSTYGRIMDILVTRWVPPSTVTVLLGSVQQHTSYEYNVFLWRIHSPELFVSSI